MKIPLQDEIIQSIDELKLATLTDWADFYNRPNWKICRDKLIAKNKPSSLAGSNFYSLPEGYQFDILVTDIYTVASNLKYSLALANLYLPYVLKYTRLPIEFKLADRLFWLAIDTGWRTCSSGWDRLALTLNLVLNLGFSQNEKDKIAKVCTFKKVMDALHKQPQYASNTGFQNLYQFYRGDFKTLEDGIGNGKRHEATHIVSVFGRFSTEVFEGPLSSSNPANIHNHAQNEVLLLKTHYDLYNSGIKNILDLVDS